MVQVPGARSQVVKNLTPLLKESEKHFQYPMEWFTQVKLGHNYQFSCLKCGFHPSVVIMDAHRKAAFSMPVSEIEEPPANFDGQVDVEAFWNSLRLEIIARGLVETGNPNPFAVKPSYHLWAPWIGPNTRKSGSVLNTEWEKVHSSNPNPASEVPVTEERLIDELMSLKVAAVRQLCASCGLDNKGSKMDLIMRLRSEMQNRSSYDKIFQKVWGASGGWAVVMCPCGVVNSIKVLVRAESPRDFADMLLSWKHLPNISIYDFARGLSTHANLRNPNMIPFSPHEGRLLEPNDANIAAAEEGRLKISLEWLKEKKMPADVNGHPLTGSSDHYVLSDRFHENNTKDPRDKLRKIQLVPELAGRVN
ncbi:unnamed protein product [Leuciscus chuanchicus]